jgi:hypothetical protein
LADIFEEVEGQLRSDRYRTLALKALPWVAGALVLALVIALAIWGYTSHRKSVDAKASEAYAAGVEALQAGDLVKADAQFKTAADAGSEGYRALGLIQQAGLKLRENKTTEAVALFDQAAEASESPLMADTARMQAVYVLMDTGNRVEIEGRLKPLLEEGRPFRMQAREALALSRLAAGDTKSARGDFVVLTQGLETPENIRSRAEAAVALIDSGMAANLPAVLKAAKAIPAGAMLAPPTQPTSPEPPQAGTAQ